jgi:hypothetical protein
MNTTNNEENYNNNCYIGQLGGFYWMILLMIELNYLVLIDSFSRFLFLKKLGVIL